MVPLRLTQHFDYNMPIVYPYTQCSGLWTASQATDAVASGTWPVPPPPLYTWDYNNYGQLGVAQALNMNLYKSGCIVGKYLEDYNLAEPDMIEVAVGRI